jgi:hypothetical protein
VEHETPQAQSKKPHDGPPKAKLFNSNQREKNTLTTSQKKNICLFKPNKNTFFVVRKSRVIVKDMTNNKTVKLQTSDTEDQSKSLSKLRTSQLPLKIYWKIIFIAGNTTNLTDLGEPNDVPIPLRNVGGKILNKVIEYCNVSNIVGRVNNFFFL